MNHQIINKDALVVIKYFVNETEKYETNILPKINQNVKPSNLRQKYKITTLIINKL